MPMEVRGSKQKFLSEFYEYAWFVGFVVAFVTYLFLMKRMIPEK